MDTNTDISSVLQEKVLDAIAQHIPVQIVGRNTKAFYGRTPLAVPGILPSTALAHPCVVGEHLSVAGHCGVISYEPTELVITARAGSSLSGIEALLATQGQMLPFEPPYFGAHAEDTLGGTIACGFSGPRRPYAGSARDVVLGMKVLTGKGEILRFGGQVMKNVAGFDVSRLMVGALGTLGILLEISLKVLPKAMLEKTQVFSCGAQEAIRRMNAWAGQSLPLSAAMFVDGQLHMRLSGSHAGLAEACKKLGGEVLAHEDMLWASVRDHKHAFFHGDTPLWRVSVPSAAPLIDIPGSWLIEWGGAQRWLKTAMTSEAVRERVVAAKGHTTLFRGDDPQGKIFHPLSPALMALHQRLKAEFDPHGIINRGRMYADW